MEEEAEEASVVDETGSAGTVMAATGDDADDTDDEVTSDIMSDSEQKLNHKRGVEIIFFFT
jgi:hypothetical protein